MKCIVVAYDTNRAIGANGDIPWIGKLPADMRHFRELTTGNTVIMGRKTYDSIGKPLPNRTNIVVTKQDVTIDGAIVVNSINEAYEKADSDKVCIIGGAQIYELTLNTVDTIYATEINTKSNGDVFFPTISDEWVETAREDFEADETNLFDYSFVTYTKRR